MPLVPPSLDDRRFDDLVEDLLARIPAHTPEWTHPRLGDPGRTLIELFAWLGDALLYRANLIPERQRLVFMKLLGMGLRPARSARGIVSLSFAQDSELGVYTLKPRGQVKGGLPFETLAETTVLPLAAEAYIKRRLTGAELARRSELLHGLVRIHRISGALAAYETTPVFAGGRAEPAGVDVFGGSADRALWVALLAPPAEQPQDQDTVNKAVRQAIGGGDAAAPALLSVGVVPALKLPQLFEQVSSPVAVPVLWEMATRGPGPFDTEYLTLSVQPGSDTSRGLARAGTLRLQLPNEDHIWVPSNDVGENPRAGVGDAPPRLDDADRASRLIAWLRLRPIPGEDVAHLNLAWLSINAVEIDQRSTLESQVLGVSTGAADQVFSLPLPSVDAESLSIEVEEAARGYQPWERIDDLAAISADANEAREARAYELDAEAGTLRFGDGVRGRVPEREMRVRLALGRFGGGRAGNLPPGSLTELAAKRIDGVSAPPIKVHQPLALSGGDDAETLSAAERRIPALLRHRDRAVTAEDYRRIALEAPAVDVGRVEVLPRFKPRDRRPDVPGVVSVMALPAAALPTLAGSTPVAAAAAHLPNPRPDRPFIERLHAHLAARTPLATELYVIGCDYVPLALTIAVEIRAGFARDRVLLEVREAMQRLLWPLPPGGVDRQGWPLGRPVRSRELEVEVSRVAGVDEVRGLQLFRERESRWEPLPATASGGSQELSLRTWQLPELLAVVAVEGTGAPTDLRSLPNRFADANAVAVPVVPELC